MVKICWWHHVHLFSDDLSSSLAFRKRRYLKDQLEVTTQVQKRDDNGWTKAMKRRDEWINTHCHCERGWQSTVSTILQKKISILQEKCWNYTIYWREGINFQDSSFEVRGGVCYLWQTVVRFLLKKVTTDLVNLESDKKKKKTDRKTRLWNLTSWALLWCTDCLEEMRQCACQTGRARCAVASTSHFWFPTELLNHKCSS